MDEECWQVPRQLCYTGRQNDTTEEREYDIMMNPASLMKIMNARNKFVENHPKFAAFLNAVFSAGITEGTVIEITVNFLIHNRIKPSNKHNAYVSFNLPQFIRKH